MRPERADYLGAVDALAAVVAASSSASQRAFSADLRAQRVVEPGIVKVGIAFTTIRSRHLCRLISKKFAIALVPYKRSLSIGAMPSSVAA
jgi:hypothetical protein